MRAFAIDSFGEPGSVRDLPTPEAAEGQVRVRVAAAGVNPMDGIVVHGYVKDMMEHRFPLIPGLDASGVIDAVGDGVEGWAVGDDVFGGVGKMFFGEGTWAELATMSAATIARKPASLEHTEAAAIPLAGLTAETLLDAVGTAEGQTLLAIGAAGGVGSYLVQLATGRGADVIGVARGLNHEYLLELGAVEVIDYTTGDVGEALRALQPDGIDAILDMVGDKDSVNRLSEQLRPSGRVASAAGGADAEALGARGIEATNVQTMVAAGGLTALAASLADGAIRSPQIEVLALADAGEALAKIGTRHVRGKLVLSVG